MGLVAFNFYLPVYASDTLSYSGRLVNTNGSPVAGPVDLKVELSYSDAPNSILCSQDFTDVALSNGVFHLKLNLTCPSTTLSDVLINVPANETTSLRVVDVSDPAHPKAYSFQAMHTMPFANISEKAKQLVQMGASNGQILKWNNTAKKWEPGSAGGLGTVLDVTVSSPLSVSNGTSTPAISISQANSTTNGYLSSADWNTFNSKEGTISGGTATQYYRGDKTWQTLNSDVVPEGATNLYFTNARVLGLPLTGFSATNSAILATDSVIQGFSKAQGQINTINSTAGNFLVKNGSDSITGTVNVGVSGFLTITNAPSILTDATNKQYVDTRDALKVSKAGDTISGDLTLDSDLKIKGGSNYVTVKGNAATSASYNLVLPTTAGTNGYVLKTDGTGNLSWVDPSSVSAGSSTVNSASITDGSIMDADVNASAAIAQSKIANLTTDLNAKISTSLSSGKMLIGDTGNLATQVTMSGDATISNTGVLFLKNTGTAGTYRSVTTDAQGRITSGTNPTTLAEYGITDAVTGVTGTAPVTVTGTTAPVVSMAAATTSVNGYLTSANWNTFNNKQDAINNTSTLTTGSITTKLQNGVNIDPYGGAAGNTGELRFYELNGTGNHYTSLKAPDNLTANINYVLPTAAPSAGQVLSSTAAGVMSWVTPTPAPVTTVFGRSGVVGASSGDYNASQITNTPAGSVAAINVQAAIDELATEKEPALPNPSDITKYYRGDKTWSTFALDAINSVLSTFTLNAGSKPAVTNADSIVVAFGKTQKFLNDINSDYVSKSANNTVTGSFNITGITSYINVPTPTGAVVTEAANVQYVQNYVGGYGQWVKGAGADIYRSSGNVGIGTSSPLALLHLEPASGNSGLRIGATGAVNSYIDFFNGGTKKANIYWNGTTNTFQVNDVGTSNTIINGAGGNVGIGNLNPTFKLTNSSQANFLDQSSMGLAGANTFVWEHPSTDTATGYTAAIANSYNNAAAFGLLVKTTDTSASNRLLTLNSGGTDRMSVLGNGNVGIGTMNPTNRFEVQKVFNGLSNISTAFIGGSDSGVTDAGVYILQKDNTGLTSNGSYLLNATINGSSKMVVTGAGNVGIGTAASPAVKLHVNTANAVDGFLLTGTSSQNISINTNNSTGSSNPLVQAGDRGIIYAGGSIDNPGGGLVLGPWASTAKGIRIDANGRVGIGTTNPTSALTVNGNITTPNQIFFEAKNCSGGVNAGTAIVWETVVSNIGSGYNAGNGVFTAPISGVYTFGFNTLLNYANAGEYRYEFFKNGGLSNGIIKQKGASSWETIQGTMTTYLSAGEYIYINYSIGAGASYTDCAYNRFWGRLGG